MDTAKVTPKEYLSNDILDKQFMNLFTWVYNIQKMLGSCRVHAQDRFVTGPTRLQKVYTLFCTLCTICLNYACIMYFIEVFNDLTLNGLSIAILTIHLITYVCHIVHVRFRNNLKNTAFHVKMQMNDRHMKIEKTREVYDTMRGVNKWSLTIVIVIYLILLTSILVERDWKYIAFAGCAFSQLTFVVELIHCSGLIMHFVVKLMFINGILKNYLSSGKKEEKRRIFLYSRRIATLAAASHTFESSETNQYLRELLECFTDFTDLYRFQLFMFTGKMVIISLIVFEILLHAIRKNKIFVSGFVTLVVFATIDVCTALVLGIRLEWFFGQVTQIKRNSIAIMNIHQDGILRKKARGMLMIIEETPPVFSIYDMWEMNGRTFLNVFTMVTSLIVTMLQFAFL